tara:strand:- start:697 stop:1569 length:873 start_codon:yes stop_codon:yes gene_type:complete
MEKVSWGRWTLALVKAAEELRESGFQMSKDPSQDNEVYQNLIALSAAEWRKGDEVDEEGPGMGKALGGEESYSPLQIFMNVWGKDTSDVDVTVINNEFVPEFQGITKDELIDLITTDVELAAKAGIIVLNSKKGYENWSTWNIVQSEDSTQYIDYAKQYDNDLLRGSQFDGDEPVTPTETTTTTMPETTTTTMPEDTEEEPQKVDTSADFRSQVPEEAGTYEGALYQTRINRLNPKYRSSQFLKYFDRVTSFKKPDPSTFKQPAIAEEDEIKFPFGTPVTTQEVLDLLEP